MANTVLVKAETTICDACGDPGAQRRGGIYLCAGCRFEVDTELAAMQARLQAADQPEPDWDLLFEADRDARLDG